MYSFKYGDDFKSKQKGVSKSQSKHIKLVKFEEYKNCLHGIALQEECNIYILL